MSLKENDVVQETALEARQEAIPAIPQQLVDPDVQIEFATKAANSLKRIIDSKPKKVIINGQQYIEFEDWQTIGRFYGLSVGTDWTKSIERDGKVAGYEARAVVLNNQGTMVGAAEAACLRDEKNWGSRYNKGTGKSELVPEFQLRSMAQTRAMAKALRSILGYVVVLAGYNATPAEEMGNRNTYTPKKWTSPKDSLIKPKKETKKPTVGYDGGPLVCADCGVNITGGVASWSERTYGKYYCMPCQPKHKDEMPGGVDKGQVKEAVNSMPI